MKEETTARLTEILSRTEGDKAGQKFAAEHSVEMGFSQYFCEFLAFRNMVLAEVVKKSGINKNYVYQIVNGSKNPSRDKVIALCIAAGMNFSETNRGLKKAGFAPLYPKDERDVYIAICINEKISSVTEVNLRLYDNGINPLDV